MSNSHFKARSAVFECRHCTRRTRDTDGSNGGIRLCEDCSEGMQWENGGNDTDDTTKKAECFAKADACFARAVGKGGNIPGQAKPIAPQNGHLYLHVMGRAVRITHVADSVEAANAAMLATPGLSLIDTLGPLYLLADKNDKGTKC